MPSISPLTKAYRGVTLLPPTAWDRDKDKDESIVVKETDILQGNLEKEMQRGQTLATAPTTPITQPHGTVRGAMDQIGSELQDGVQKDQAWYVKALGLLEPFKYLDIPIELAAEGVEGIAKAIIPGEQGQWWGEGTAERDDFEAWRALFGGDVSAEKTGWGEVRARMDIAAGAFEKRPLIAQLGLGAIQIAASLGAGSFAKGVQLGTKMSGAGLKGVIAARAARAGAMILDPYEVGFIGIKYGFRGAKAIKKGLHSRSPMKDGAGGFDNGMIEDEIFANDIEVGAGDYWIGDVHITQSVETPQISPIGTFFDSAPTERVELDVEKMWDAISANPSEASRFSLVGESLIGSTDEAGIKRGNIHRAIHHHDGEPVLPEILQRGNKIRELTAHLYTTAKQLDTGSDEQVDALRKLLAIQLTLSIGARKGHSFSATAKAVWGGPGIYVEKLSPDKYRPLIDSGKLVHKHIDGRGALLNPLDMGEARKAAQLYKESLEAWSKKNSGEIPKFDPDKPLAWIGDDAQILTFDTKARETRKWFRTDTEVFEGFDGGPAKNLKAIDDILKEFAEIDPDRWALLPTDARLLRQQVATELMQSGWEFSDTQLQLRHMDKRTTASYIRAIPWLGEGSERFKFAAFLEDLMGKVGTDEGVKQRTLALEFKWDEVKAKKIERRKGETELAVDRELLSLELGELVQDMDELEAFIPMEWAKKFEVHKENVDKGIYAEKNVLATNLIGRAIKNVAIHRLIDQIQQLEDASSLFRQTINHNYSPKDMTRKQFYEQVAVGGKSFQAPGLMNRAGYYIEDGKVVWIGDTTDNPIVKKVWQERRETVRNEMALSKEEFGFTLENKPLKSGRAMKDKYGSGEAYWRTTNTTLTEKAVEQNWANWAIRNYDHIQQNTKKFDASFNIKDVKNVKGHTSRRKYKLHEHLAHYAEEEGWQLAWEWQEVIDAGTKANIGDFEGFDWLFYLVKNSRVASLENKGRVVNNYFTSGQHAFNEAMRDLDKLIVNNQTFDDFWRLQISNPLIKLFPKNIEKRMLEGVPLSELQAWIRAPEVVSAFSVVKMSGKDTAEEILSKLHTLAEKTPRLFGDSFARFHTEHGQSANAFMDVLSQRLANNRDLWTEIEFNRNLIYKNEIDRVAALPDRRMPVQSEGLTHNGLPEEMGGMTTKSIVRMDTIDMVIPRIEQFLTLFGKKFKSAPDALTGKQVDISFTEWLNTDVRMARVLRLPLSILSGVISGGRAGIAHPLTRALSSRVHLYGKSELPGQNVRTAVQDKAVRNLGLTVAKPTDAQLQVGVEEGLEYFEKLELQDWEAINSFELSDVGKAAYKDFAGETGVGGAGHIASRIMGSNAAGAQLLRHPDVVLERIRPEHWKYYFKDADVGQTMYKELVYIRSIIQDMDRYMHDIYGIDVRRVLEDRDVDYLWHGYSPRMYLRHMAENANSKRNVLGSLSNDSERFFNKRDDDLKDILQVLSISHGRHATRNAQDFILAPLAERYGKYVETMHKRGIDKHTKDWLLAQPAFKMANKLASTISTNDETVKAATGVFAEIEEGKLVLNNDKLQVLKQVLGEEEGLDVDIFNEGSELFTATDARRAEILAPWKKVIDDLALENDELRISQRNSGNDITNYTEHSWLQASGRWQGFRNLDTGTQRALNQYLQVSNSFLGDPLKWAGTAAKTPTEMIRYFKSGLDVGAPMIHGFNALVRFPVGPKSAGFESFRAWLRGTKEMGMIMWDPDNYDRFMIDNLADFQEAGRYVNMGRAEPLVAADSKALDVLKKRTEKMIRGMGWPEEKRLLFLKRFETSFTGNLNVMRTMLWKSMRESVDNEIDTLAKKAQKLGTGFDRAGITNQKYHDLGATISKMTGAYDPHLAQQTPFQGLIENSLIFFAPMYRRATYGILGDIVKGVQKGEWGIRQEQALRQLAGVITVGVGMGALAEMTGVNPRGFLFDKEGELGKGEGALDITHRFGKWNIQGVQVGIGTAWWTALRAAGDIAMNQAHDDRPMSDSEHWTDWWPVKMLERRGRSQLAPGTALVTDLFTGRNFVGEPLRDVDENNYVAMGQHVGRGLIPFWLDGMFAGGFGPGSGVAMSAEFLGLQAYEISSWDRFAAAREAAVHTSEISEIKEWRQQQRENGLHGSWTYMPRELQDILLTSTTELRALAEEHEKQYGPMAAGDAADLRAYMKEKAQYELEGIRNLVIVSRLVETGRADYGQLQDAIKTYRVGNRVGTAARMEKYPTVAAYFSQERVARDQRESVFAGDIVYDAWQALRNDDKWKNPVDGTYNWEAANAAADIFWLDPQNAAHKEYSLRRADEWMNDLPTVHAFEKAKDYLTSVGYYSIHDRLWPSGSTLHHKASIYVESTRDYKDYLREMDPDFRLIARRIAEERRRMAQNDAIVDYNLIKYYGNNPKHPSNEGLKQRLLVQAHSGLPVTAHQDRFKVSELGRVEIGPEDIELPPLTGVQ